MSLNLRIAKLGSAIDSATTGHFLSKGATDAVFRAVSSGLDSATITNLVDSAYIQLRDRFQDSSGITAIVDSAYVQARQSSASGGLDSAAVTTLIDSAYVQARQTSVGSGGLDSAATISLINNNTNSGFYKYKYTATSGQTVFADSDANGNVMSFDPNSTLVFYNGVLLDETTDYTASSNTITLTSGADAGVSITVAKYGVGYTPPAFSWGGDRAIIAGGSNVNTAIDYYDITTASNASDFGDLYNATSEAGACGDGTYGVILGGGGTSASQNGIQYVTISTLSNASNFGTLFEQRSRGAACSDGSRGLFIGKTNTIEYITIASPGNGADFGDLTVARTDITAMTSDATYGLAAGGNGSGNVIDYVTIATPSNATDFGDLTISRYGLSGASSVTRSVFGAGLSLSPTTYYDVIEYVTTATPSNATDFGNLLSNLFAASSCSNGTTQTFNSGYTGSADINTIQYITIDTPSNATDLADLITAQSRTAATSGSPS